MTEDEPPAIDFAGVADDATERDVLAIVAAARLELARRAVSRGGGQSRPLLLAAAIIVAAVAVTTVSVTGRTTSAVLAGAPASDTLRMGGPAPAWDPSVAPSLQIITQEDVMRAVDDGVGQ